MLIWLIHRRRYTFEVIARITSVIGSLEAEVEAGKTPVSDFFTALPSDAASYFGSLYTAEQSIFSANGFGAQANGNKPTGGSQTGAPTSTSTGGAVHTQAAGIAAAGFVGFMGVVMAL